MNSEIKWGPWDSSWPNQAMIFDDNRWEYALIQPMADGIKGCWWVCAEDGYNTWMDGEFAKTPFARIFRRHKSLAQPAQPSAPVSIRILEQAAQIQRDRSATYDQGGTMEGERSMGRTVAAFNTITGRDLSESEGWLLLQILKDVRDRANGPHEDSLVDCTSYSSLKAEARLREGKP